MGSNTHRPGLRRGETSIELSGQIAAVDDPLADLERRELKGAFNAAVQHLSGLRRKVFLLHDVEGLDHGEIARYSVACDRSVATAAYKSPQVDRTNFLLEAYFKTEPSEMMFKIGRNPLQSEDRPWTYVPVRHVPVDPESFKCR